MFILIAYFLKPLQTPHTCRYSYIPLYMHTHTHADELYDYHLITLSA